MIHTMACSSIMLDIMIIRIMIHVVKFFIVSALLVIIFIGFEKINDFFIKSDKITNFFDSDDKVSELGDFLITIYCVFAICYEVFYIVTKVKC